MYTWSTFQKALPALHSIENAWQQYLNANSLANLYDGILEDHASSSQTESEALRNQIFSLVESLPGDLCFWHFPFYKGDFLELREAVETFGGNVRHEATQEVRDRFRQFMRSMSETDLGSIPETLSHPARKTKSMALLRQLARQRQALAELTSDN